MSTISRRAVRAFKNLGKNKVETPIQSQTPIVADLAEQATSIDNLAAPMPDATVPVKQVISLWCLVDGDSRPFKVTTLDNADVMDLKELIKEKKRPELDYLAANTLNLWMLKNPVTLKPQGTLAGRVLLQGNDLSEFATNLEEDSDTLSDIFLQPPPAKHLHVIVKLPTDHRPKRPRMGSPLPDISPTLLQRWATPCRPPPPLDALSAYIMGPLEDNCKIPLPDQVITELASSRANPKAMCTRDDLLKLFRPSEDEGAAYIMDIIKPALIFPPPDEDSTESSFHHFWDRNLRQLLDSAIVCKTIRDSNNQTSTALLRPDFGVLTGGVCIFRGEEKSPRFSGTHPKDELIEKLTWTYDPAPYILGYYAVGAHVTLAAILRDSVIDLVFADLLWMSQRLTNLIRIIKLCSVITSLRDVIGARHNTELVSISRLETGTIIKIGSSAVEKKYMRNGEARVNHLRTIYELMQAKHVPNVDRILNFYVNDDIHGSVVYLQPKGIDDSPRRAQEVLEAVKCVLEALKVMHDGPIALFHRDIRWPNIIRDGGTRTKWFLIDWDDAAIPPTQAAMHLDRNSHCPSVFLANHGAEVDIWSAGRLIVDAVVFASDIPAGVRALGMRMMSGEILSAAAALDELNGLV